MVAEPSPGRPPARPLVLTMSLLAFAALLPGGLPGQEPRPPRYPVDIQRSAGGRELLGLRKENGFEDLEKEVTFIIDPRAGKKESSAYRPDDPALQSIESTDLKVLLDPGAGMKVVAQQAVKEVFDSFFKLIQREDKAAYRTDLLDVLRATGDPARLLVTVETRFAVRPPGAGGGGKGRLECRVALKAFKLKLAADASLSRSYANLTSCELLYEDSATGDVPLEAYADPVLLAKASVVDALRNGLAVTFCMSPGVRESLSEASVMESRGKSILGDSISPFPPVAGGPRP